MEFGFGEPEGALRGTLALEDAGGGFEPAATQGVFRREQSKGFGVEGAEGGGGVKGEGVEGPVALGQKWGQERVARREGGGFPAEVDQGGAFGLEL